MNTIITKLKRYNAFRAMSVMLAMVLLCSSMTPLFAGGIDDTLNSLNQSQISNAGTSGGAPKGGIVSNCYALNVRSGPGTDNPIIGGLSAGCAISIISEENGWWKIKYNGGVGYVSGKYIDTSSAMVSEDEKAESFSGAVNVETSLNIRNSPWGDILGSFKNGDKVEVVGKAGAWYKIKYNGGFAYVYASYIQKAGATAANSQPSNNGTALPKPQTAAGDDSWKNGFNKAYTMSDKEFTNKDSMTKAEIQAFLAKKNSVLSREVDGRLPADMIYDSAQKYNISPKVILATLQKEQGLVSKTSATQKQLDWALGCGAYDGGNWNQSFKGLANQIDGGTKTLRKWYDYAQDKLNKGESISMTIDGESVAVKNAATYSNYKYTPHFAGNKLFQDVYLGWF
ncbi:MAG TPA: SH3 domain-containing protein [Candidatus Wallbacteria bacterium]|nr:SH3 domain-containing protein [Candidatus Wallbacteria bacterium]